MPALKHNMDDNPISPGADAQSFWILAKKLSLMTERERISSIRSGFAVTWLLAAKTAFDLDESAIASFADISIKTLRQRLKKPHRSARQRLSDLTAWPSWLCSQKLFSRLGEPLRTGLSPPMTAWVVKRLFFLCRTELGGRQAYRVLRAIEWGGPV